MDQILLITISGHDQPGLTSAFAQALAGAGAIILDIGQAVIHDALALGLMVSVPDSKRLAASVKSKKQSKRMPGSWE